MANYDGTNCDGWTLEQGNRAPVEGVDRVPSGGPVTTDYALKRGVIGGTYTYWTTPTQPDPVDASDIVILQRWTA
jgi:hypothetical protein